MTGYRAAGLVLAAAFLALAAGPATARPALRIAALRLVAADGRTPAAAPYRRGERYRYVVDYLVAGAPRLRVTRAATIASPRGLVAIVRPPATVSAPGRYRVSGGVRIGSGHPPGVYAIRYTIVARSPDGASARRLRILRVRFV